MWIASRSEAGSAIGQRAGGELGQAYHVMVVRTSMRSCVVSVMTSMRESQVVKVTERGRRQAPELVYKLVNFCLQTRPVNRSQHYKSSLRLPPSGRDAFGSTGHASITSTSGS